MQVSDGWEETHAIDSRREKVHGVKKMEKATSGEKQLSFSPNNSI